MRLSLTNGEEKRVRASLSPVFPWLIYKSPNGVNDV